MIAMFIVFPWKTKPPVFPAADRAQPAIAKSATLPPHH